MTIVVTMYAKDSCPYCRRAEALLRERGCEQLNKLRIDFDPAVRAAMVERTGARTVPQIYIGDVYVGGCEQLIALDVDGRLGQLLHQAPWT